MNQYAAQMMPFDWVLRLWGDIRPLLAESCTANELTESTLTPEHILGLLATDQATMLGFFENGNIKLCLVLQFTEDDGHKAASILAFAGEDMMLYKKLYWDYVVDWLKRNNFTYLDTFANPRMAKVFQRKFGFTQASMCVRMPLKENTDG